MKTIPTLLSIALLVCTLQANGQTSRTEWNEGIATVVGTLDSGLGGSSSLFFWNEQLWTSNDHGFFAMHQLDRSTARTSRMLSEEVAFDDMEEVTQDDRYFYFGDFGNNRPHPRHDLRILRLDKERWSRGDCRMDTIAFTYPGYNPDGEPARGMPTTDFDCEAMVAAGDSLYLFTKQWSAQRTTCFRLPKQPGRHTATPMFSLDVDGLVTGACLFERRVDGTESRGMLVLCGYSLMAQPFVYVIYHFSGTDFGHGDRIKIFFCNNIGVQTEAIATHDGLHYWVTNEAFNQMEIARPAQLRRLDLTEYFHDYLYPDLSPAAVDGLQIESKAPAPVEEWLLGPNPTDGLVRIMATTSQGHEEAISGKVQVEVRDTLGHTVPAKTDRGWIDLRGMAPGTYRVRLTTPRGEVIDREVILEATR